MTARQALEATLIELNKINAPTLKLYEFNYLVNKAINQYVNKIYNMYDINQQTTDDLRVLKSTAYLTPIRSSLANHPINNIPKDSEEITYYTESDTIYKKFISKKVQNGILTTKTDIYVSSDSDLTLENAPLYNNWTLQNTNIKEEELYNPVTSKNSLHGATYEIKLPQDYLHLLNCVCIFHLTKDYNCWNKDSYIEIPATRLTADSWSQIIMDVYNRPTPMRPYFYIHNININQTLPTGENDLSVEYNVTNEDGSGTNDASNFPRTFKLGNLTNASVIRKPIASRIGNTTEVRCEIRYGKDDSLFQLAEVQVDYIKVPQHIRLTQEQIDLTEDTSQIMEFPDYVNQEIINELVHLVMERSSDPRLNTNMQISQSIARPTGQQQQP